MFSDGYTCMAFGCCVHSFLCISNVERNFKRNFAISTPIAYVLLRLGRDNASACATTLSSFSWCLRLRAPLGVSASRQQCGILSSELVFDALFYLNDNPDLADSEHLSKDSAYVSPSQSYNLGTRSVDASTCGPLIITLLINL